MNCCPYCFSDSVARGIVEELAHNELGSCEFCGKANVPIVDVSPECELRSYFDDMLEVFAPAGQVPEHRWLSEKPLPFAEAFASLWSVFSIDIKTVELFLGALYGEEDWFDEFSANTIVVTPDQGNSDISAYSLFGTKTWDDFVESIKQNLRFHTRIENEELFENICNVLSQSTHPDQCWYRARVWNKDRAPENADLYEAPSALTRNGRMNVAGIPCLYIANSPLTAISETRASQFDTMAVARMRPKRMLGIVDLSRIHSVSPFDEISCNVLAANIDNLKLIRRELLRPMRRTDPELDYLPTEYISDLIKSLGYDGIGYKSVMSKNGYNIASFRTVEEGFDIRSIDMYHVDEIDYSLKYIP